MALSAANLTTFNQDALLDTDWVSASISPTGNALILITIVAATNAGVDVTAPTVTGNGITYEQINISQWDTSSGSRRATILMRGMATSPSSGAVTVDWGAQTSLRGAMVIDEITGATTGNNGADAIVQSAVNDNEGSPATSLTITLASFGSVNNATYGAFGENTTYTAVAGSGFALVGGGLGTNETAATEFRNDNDTSVDMSYTEDVTTIGGVAIEIQQAVAGTAIQDLIGAGIIPFAR